MKAAIVVEHDDLCGILADYYGVTVEDVIEQDGRFVVMKRTF